MSSNEVIKELDALVKYARKNGLKSLNLGRGGEISFEISDRPLPKRTRTSKTDKSIEQQIPEFSEDDVLNWSAE